VRRTLEAALFAALAFFLPTLAELVGMQLAGSLWLAAGLTLPWLSQAGEIAGGLLGGALLGAFLRPLHRVRFWPVVGACVAFALAYAAYRPAALLAAPAAAGGVAALQDLPPARVRGAALSGALAAMAHLLPFPAWGRVLLCAGAGISLAVSRSS
jgi:hypothetical protein